MDFRGCPKVIIAMDQNGVLRPGYVQAGFPSAATRHDVLSGNSVSSTRPSPNGMALKASRLMSLEASAARSS
jgi:hypothetical protein